MVATSLTVHLFRMFRCTELDKLNNNGPLSKSYLVVDFLSQNACKILTMLLLVFVLIVLFIYN